MCLFNLGLFVTICLNSIDGLLTQWHHMVSENLVTIGSDNGYWPILQQVITQTNADFMLNGQREETWVKFESKQL